MSAISSRIVFQLFPEVYNTFPLDIFISPMAILRSSMGGSFLISSFVLLGEVWDEASDWSNVGCSGDWEESVFEGGELCRTWAARSVTRDSRRCIRCCR